VILYLSFPPFSAVEIAEILCNYLRHSPTFSASVSRDTCFLCRAPACAPTAEIADNRGRIRRDAHAVPVLRKLCLTVPGLVFRIGRKPGREKFLMTEDSIDRAAAWGQPRDGCRHFDLAERAARFGYWRMALADNSMYCSDGVYRLLGVEERPQAPDMAWLLAQFQPDDAARLRRHVEAAIATGSPFRCRAYAQPQSAAARVIDTNGEVETGPDGSVIAVVGVCTDVTAEVTAEAERETAQARFRVMAEESSDIIMLLENGRAVSASNALGRVLGLTPEDIQGGRYLDVVHPDDLGEAQKLRGRPNPGEIWTGTYRARHAKGHYVWLEASTRGLAEAPDGTHREVTVARDITERKEQELKVLAAQERAEAASRAKSLFLANMSHELRTPLNAIIGFAEIMQHHMFGALGDSRYEDYATQIYNSGRFLLNQFCDILDMAQIEAGMLELKFEPFDLTETIEECVRQVRGSVEQRGLVLALDVPAGGVPLIADRRAVRQILLNLLSNALKFTKPGGHVSVGTRQDGTRVTLLVGDDGVGIPAGALGRLGRPFEQVCADPYLAKGGQGLGLALVHALAKKHAGAVTIESKEGGGTVVRVEFPAESARAA
jgi:two-component system cell cycle sensor histidine kinase PleC